MVDGALLVIAASGYGNSERIFLEMEVALLFVRLLQ